MNSNAPNAMNARLKTVFRTSKCSNCQGHNQREISKADSCPGKNGLASRLKVVRVFKDSGPVVGSCSSNGGWPFEMNEGKNLRGSVEQKNREKSDFRIIIGGGTMTGGYGFGYVSDMYPSPF